MKIFPRCAPGSTRLLLVMALVAVAPAIAVDTPAADPAPAPPAAADAAGMLGTTDGSEIYRQICQGCHMADGLGAEGGGSYPAFAGNPRLASPEYLATTILGGRRNMPAFAQSQAPQLFFPPTWLTDQQVANVINYIRTNFGNTYPADVSAEQVRAVRPQPGD